MQRDTATLLDVIQAGELITEFVQGIDKVAFDHDLRNSNQITSEIGAAV